ncbi:MAG: MtrB/PioB family decaheme-associated outer membrane protein [Nitrospirota bacterium]
MKTTLITLAIILGLMTLSSNAVAEEKKMEGGISVTGMLTEVNGSEAKFNEYRDTQDGVYGDIRLGYESGRYYFDLKAANFGYAHNSEDWGFDNQRYDLSGGIWGKFKYDFFYDEIPHNITYGARSFYSGIGTGSLTGAPIPLAPGDVTIADAWNAFDYSLKRKQYGGGIRLDAIRPFFFDVSAAREERDGIRPTAASTGTPGQGAVELPAPIDYVTNTLKAEAGYSRKPLYASVSFLYSNFDNDNEVLSFQHPVTGGVDNTSLPPGNEYYKGSFKGAVNLPFNSKFDVNLGFSRKESNPLLITSYVFEGAAASVDYGGRTTFDGKIDTQNYAFALTSRPVRFLDTKLFYRYYEWENKSDRITHTDSGSGVTLTNRLFDYHKNSAGIELGFRLPANFHITPAYKYVKTNRSREDLPETEDDIYSIDARWTGLDFLTVRAGYERLERDAEHGQLTVVTGVQAEQDVADVVEPFLRRFDAGPQDRDTYRASVELYPLEALNVGFGFQYKKSDYKDTVFGLHDDKRYEFNVDADYAIGRFARLFAYFDYERTKLYQFQRQAPFNADAGLMDPTVPPVVLVPPPPPGGPVFNWDVTQVNESYDYGAATDIYLIPRKLTLQLQYNHVDSDGSADYTYFFADALTLGRTNENIDIDNWDDYRKDLFIAKVIFNVTKAFSLSAGYAYEQYKYNDATLDGYIFAFPIATPNTFLTGAYADQSYNANVVFATVAYKF